MGHAYRWSGMHEEAIDSYKASLEVNPDNIFAYIGLVASYSLLSRESEAF